MKIEIDETEIYDKVKAEAIKGLGESIARSVQNQLARPSLRQAVENACMAEIEVRLRNYAAVAISGKDSLLAECIAEAMAADYIESMVKSGRLTKAIRLTSTEGLAALWAAADDAIDRGAKRKPTVRKTRKNRL